MTDHDIGIWWNVVASGRESSVFGPNSWRMWTRNKDMYTGPSLSFPPQGLSRKAVEPRDWTIWSKTSCSSKMPGCCRSLGLKHPRPMAEGAQLSWSFSVIIIIIIMIIIMMMISWSQATDVVNLTFAQGLQQILQIRTVLLADGAERCLPQPNPLPSNRRCSTKHQLHLAHILVGQWSHQVEAGATWWGRFGMDHLPPWGFRNRANAEGLKWMKMMK